MGAEVVRARFGIQYATTDTNQTFFVLIAPGTLDTLPADIQRFLFARYSDECIVFRDPGKLGNYVVDATFPRLSWPFTLFFIHITDLRATQVGIGQDCARVASSRSEAELEISAIDADWALSETVAIDANGRHDLGPLLALPDASLPVWAGERKVFYLFCPWPYDSSYVRVRGLDGSDRRMFTLAGRWFLWSSVPRTDHLLLTEFHYENGLYEQINEVTLTGDVKATYSTLSDATDSWPVASPDGGYMAFVREGTGAQEVALCVRSRDAANETVTVIHRWEEVNILNIGWFPDSRHLFVSCTPGEEIALHEIYDVLRPLENPETWRAGGPSWRVDLSPDGKYVAFIGKIPTPFDTVRLDVGIMPLNGGDPLWLERGVSPFTILDWSQEGRNLMLWHLEGNERRLFVWRIPSLQ